jgi:glycosyltransferase involved in cell wall biosynthesis
MPVKVRAFDPLPEQPLVSCLCVTEDRAAFLPWLLWGFDRQDWQRRELVIVDGSSGHVDVAERPDVRLVTVPSGSSIARKRNVALQAAAGDLVAWVDDDDWQHPRRLAWLVEALRGGQAFAGSQAAWFVDVEKSRCTPYRGGRRSVIFNSSGFRTDAVRAVAFREDVARASDTHWMRAVEARHVGFEVIDRDDLFFWLSHARNISNPASGRHFPHRLDVLRSRVGTLAWGDTDDQLQALQSRLERQPGGARTGGRRHDQATVLGAPLWTPSRGT